MAEAFGVAASALAVAELSAKIIKVCAQYTKDVTKAREDIERLKKEVNSLGDLANSVQDLLGKSQLKVTTIARMHPILSESQIRLKAIQAKLDPGKRKTAMRKLHIRALTWPFKSQDVEKNLQGLGRLTQAISLAIQVDQTVILHDMYQKMALAKLPTADGAAYNSHADEHNPQCLPDTRIEVLQEISGWTQDPNAKTVYWLNGMAGTGKSTISRTLAHMFSESGTLGATFFFKRGEGDRGGMSKFFTTIASQLIQQVPKITEHVQAAIDADPAVISKALPEQFDKLIIDPLLKTLPRASPRQRRLLIIIIDALDECEREKDLKFFLTSRPELPIRLGFKAIDGTYQDFILHEVAEPVIEHDIAAYLKHELRRIQQEFDQSNSGDRQLSANWPTRADLQTLVRMAIPLFIFAATVCRFISDGRVGSPDEQLQEVLQYQSKNPKSQLDATYLPVLNQMVTGLHPRDLSRVLERFHKVVGSIIALASPLSTFALAELLEIRVAIVDNALRTLHSVLSIPISPQQPVRPLHLSFRDFLIDPTRRDDPFWINEKKTQH
ncbi:hypothetical protein TruAng_003093 [Truncatella angustata]|nr:hypothetical protein TruAng_003093 [Truncatella angustata]